MVRRICAEVVGGLVFLILALSGMVILQPAAQGILSIFFGMLLMTSSYHICKNITDMIKKGK